MSVASPVSITFSVNGLPIEYCGPGGRRLIDVLRTDLGLTGTKEGCGEGECGACSVLLDRQVVASCLVPVGQVDGNSITTIEGLVDRDGPEPLEAAFLRAGAAQCGFCTPGMLVAARAFLDSGIVATDAAVREAIAGNLCRCTGYTPIVEAIQVAAAVEPLPAGDGQSAAARRAPVQALETGDGLEVVVPDGLADALRWLAAGDCRPVAGGTDLMVGLAPAGVDAAAAKRRALLDISRLDELHGIRVADDSLVVGALETYAALRRSPLVAERLPVLAEAAAAVGAAQIQNRGTIGGNVMTASPAGDMLPLLLATDATLVLRSVRGERTVAAEAFWPAYRQTAAAPDELLVRIEIPLPAGRQVRFRKVGTRRAQAISKAVLAVAWREDGGAWRDVRVAAGSVAPTPVRARQAEAALEGSSPSAGVAERAAAALSVEVSPIDDIRSTAAYRRAVSGRVLRRIVLDEARAERGAAG